MISLAHFGDPHVSPLPTPRAAELCSKRALGYLSWQLRRKHVHRLDVLRSLTEDAVALDVDHIAVVGDLTNIALPGEFPQALAWLRSLGPPTKVSLVPGNHDAYVPVAWERTVGLWHAYMAGDEPTPAGTAGRDAFPWVRVRGSVALVGVNTAVPTLPFFATGEVGERQLERLETALAALGAAGRFRVVVIHHPPLDTLTKWRKRLVDSARLGEIVARAGAELVLHGHTHQSSLAWMDGPRSPIPVLGVTSPSCDGSEHADLRARYNVYRISGEATRWHVTAEARGIREDGSIGTIEQLDLAVPRRAEGSEQR